MGDGNHRLRTCTLLLRPALSTRHLETSFVPHLPPRSFLHPSTAVPVLRPPHSCAISYRSVTSKLYLCIISPSYTYLRIRPLFSYRIHCITCKPSFSSSALSGRLIHFSFLELGGGTAPVLLWSHPVSSPSISLFHTSTVPDTTFYLAYNGELRKQCRRIFFQRNV